MLVHTWNFSYVEGIGWRIIVQSSLGKTVKSCLKNNLNQKGLEV
jgi:hypothetical protein